MKKGGGFGKKEEKPEDAIDEVVQLLKLTQDDLLLKLTVNNHHKSKPIFKFQPSSSSSSTLNSDLDRRFEALRSKPSKPNIQNQDIKEEEDVDNLFARFAALKGGESSNCVMIEEKHNHGIDDDDDDDDDDDEDEVARIISWAVDAARLDLSPSSDVDQDDQSDNDSDADVDDDVVKRKVIGKHVTPKVIAQKKVLKK